MSKVYANNNEDVKQNIISVNNQLAARASFENT